MSFIRAVAYIDPMKIKVTINLKKIAENLRRYNGKIILMVKGDAYGHGAVAVSKYAEPLVYGFGVATIEEGLALRENGIVKPILVCQPLPREIDKAVRYNLTPTIANFNALATSQNLGAKVALKINTGMNRFGFDPHQMSAVKSRLDKGGVEEVYSHIYSPFSAKEQCAVFERITAELGQDAPKHIFASSTAKSEDKIVRIGLNAYEGAMTVESLVVAVRKLNKGDVVGYGSKMPGDGYVAWIFGGYAEGINRENPQPVLVGGRICSTVAVCMDTICVYTGDYESKVGDVVVLQNQTLTAQYIAEKTSTIPYVVMTSRVGRIERVYTQ